MVTGDIDKLSEEDYIAAIERSVGTVGFGVSNCVLDNVVPEA